MTKEQLQDKIEYLQSEINRQTTKINAMENTAFYMRDAARAEVYDNIFTALRELIDRGGEIRITSNGIFKE